MFITSTLLIVVKSFIIELILFQYVLFLSECNVLMCSIFSAFQKFISV